MQRTATLCNAMRRNATQCNTLQHTATHCNTLQHTATHCNTLQRAGERGAYHDSNEVDRTTLQGHVTKTGEQVIDSLLYLSRFLLLSFSLSVSFFLSVAFALPLSLSLLLSLSLSLSCRTYSFKGLGFRCLSGQVSETGEQIINACMLQHTATRAKHYNTSATHCNALQHTAAR